MSAAFHVFSVTHAKDWSLISFAVLLKVLLVIMTVKDTVYGSGVGHR